MYHQPTQPPSSDGHVHFSPTSPPPPMDWHNNTSNGPVSTRHPTNVYTMMNPAPNHVEYHHHPHPDANPFVPPSQPDSFAHRHPHLPPINHHQPNDSLAFHSPQVESSIGPSRILTRRRARAAEQSQHSPDDQNHASNYSYELQRPQQSSAFSGHPQQMSRAATPADAQPEPVFGMRGGIPPYMLNTGHAYSPYTFVPSHSRSTSGSGSGSGSASTNPRSASPALSVASALTSASSASASGSHNTSSLPAAPLVVPDTVLRKNRKQKLTNADRKQICRYQEENPTMKQDQIAAHFGVERSTVSKILKAKQNWLNKADDEVTDRSSRTRPTKFPWLEFRLLDWLKECKKNKTIITDALIRNTAKQYALDMGITEEKFKASSGWVENFKNRHGIRKGIFNGYPQQKKASRVAPREDNNAGVPEYLPDQPAQVQHEGYSMRLEQDGHTVDPILRPAWTTDSGMHLQLPSSHSPVIEPSPSPPPLPTEPMPITVPDGPDQGKVVEVVPKIAIYSDGQCPTAEEAEMYFDKVLTYIEHEVNDDAITEPERRALYAVKCNLFQRNVGVPYDRSTIL
ncbi:Tigger transposable element-derived protein [Sparassis crispa]|uniref:Tigger transposable element-derived protein n=1 Tax=Sparassis crispa TaxID=139825 RepID=A0A401GN71_9APHY|nr:Tigger transposable element-derived protein [Sparassis crispa]GBE83194.1 Tigger transposable element-derived protein [Sparassis crispa]